MQNNPKEFERIENRLTKSMKVVAIGKSVGVEPLSYFIYYRGKLMKNPPSEIDGVKLVYQKTGQVLPC